jgi:hypothetical protein
MCLTEFPNEVYRKHLAGGVIHLNDAERIVRKIIQ